MYNIRIRYPRILKYKIRIREYWKSHIRYTSIFYTADRKKLVQFFVQHLMENNVNLKNSVFFSCFWMHFIHFSYRRQIHLLYSSSQEKKIVQGSWLTGMEIN